MVLSAVLGDAFSELPPVLQDFHSGRDSVFVGTAEVRYGGMIAKGLGRLGGFPKAGQHVPLRMSISATSKGEVWERDFGGQVLCSTLWQDGPKTVSERLGGVVVRMRPVVRDAGLVMPVIGIYSLGTPVPTVLLGECGGYETMTHDGRIAFDVASHLIGLGLVIRYSGTLSRA